MSSARVKENPTFREEVSLTTSIRPRLSIVIPAYNEGAPDRLPKSLEDVYAFVEKQPFEIEVVIVNNNSTDNTLEIANNAADEHPYIRVITEPTQGKGVAVKTGMMSAQGEYLFICDADFSMPVEEVTKFLPPECEAYDIAIASREIEGSRRVGEPEIRHIMGRVFNFIVKLVAVRGLNDTQCGFKCFRRDVAEAIFPLQTINGWGFDVELLFIAQKRGYKIVEIPITWIYKDHSKINPLRDSINMFLETFKVRRNGWRGVYDKKQTGV